MGVTVMAVLSFAVSVAAQAYAATPRVDHHNVLMITVDDLRPQLNVAYGMTETITPNLDKFAEGALVFHRAYCQQAVCSPSRNSFMSGRRPDTTKVWNFINHFREEGIGSKWMSLPQWFKVHDYITLASGKLFHPAHPPLDDYPTSWTTDPAINPWYWGNQAPIGDASPCGSGGINSANITHPLREKFGNGLACYNTDSRAMADDDNKTVPQLQQRVEYAHRLATRTIEYMAYAKAQGKNFYIGIGIRKPHLPWRHPKQFWDLYEGKSLTTAKHQTIGENITTLAFERNGGQGYSGTFNGHKFGESPDHNNGLSPLPQELQAGLRRGYYASVSFMDHEVGRVLDELDTMGFTANTAVLFHADHGWKLGEHGDWSKCTNWELDARVPLIIRAPWITASVGKNTLAIAELVDIFPTLVDLAGLPQPPASEGLEGISLLPVLQDPSSAGKKTMAFSQYPRCPEYSMYSDPTDYECLNIPATNFSHMGFSVRVDNARYTEWRLWKSNCVGDWTPSGLVAQELYDHSDDKGFGPETFDNFEFVNLAYSSVHKSQVQELAAALLKQFGHDSATCPPPNKKGFSVLED